MSNERWDQRASPREDDAKADRQAEQTDDHAQAVGVQDEVLRVSEDEKTGGARDCGAIAPVLGQPSLDVSAEEEFFEQCDQSPTGDPAEKPELPAAPRCIE